MRGLFFEFRNFLILVNWACTFQMHTASLFFWLKRRGQGTSIKSYDLRRVIHNLKT